MGINRNIVECKCFRPMLPEDSMTVLIETLWNVNRVPTVPYLAKGAGINRNIVECKYVQWLEDFRIR